MDDTLYNRDEVYKNTFRIFNTLVVPTSLDFEDFNLEYQKCSLIEYDRYMQGLTSLIDYQLDRFINTYHNKGIKINRDEAIIFQALYDYFKANISINEYMYETLLYLKENTEVELFLLTNGPVQNQSIKIANLGLQDIIKEENIFISGALQLTKPQPEIFQYVTEQMQYDKNQFLYVGDHWENDIYSALKYGWNAIYYNIKNEKAEVLEGDFKRRLLVVNDAIEIYNYIRENF